MALKNCRTCIHSVPLEDGDGTWGCTKHSCSIDHEKQIVGCLSHKYRSEMVPDVCVKVMDTLGGTITADPENLSV